MSPSDPRRESLRKAVEDGKIATPSHWALLLEVERERDTALRDLAEAKEYVAKCNRELLSGIEMMQDMSKALLSERAIVNELSEALRDFVEIYSPKVPIGNRVTYLERALEKARTALAWLSPAGGGDE